MYFITEAAFNQGLNPHVYVTYRFILAGLVVIPFAYFLGRKSRPELTLALFLEILLISLLGIGLTVNMLFISMRCTSPTFVASVFNFVPSLTFVIAILLRMETVNAKSSRGKAKILRTLMSLSGVMVITLHKGPALQSLWDAPIHMKRALSIYENWVLGSILSVLSCIRWSSWFIMQAHSLKKNPAQPSLIAWFNCIRAAPSALFAVSLQHKPAARSIKMFSIDFWAVVCCARHYWLWDHHLHASMVCESERSSLCSHTFNPLQTVMVAFVAYFVFGEKLYTGSILGGITVIIGLYVLLWGKHRDHSYTNSQEQSSSPSDEIEAAKNEVASAENQERNVRTSDERGGDAMTYELN